MAYPFFWPAPTTSLDDSSAVLETRTTSSDNSAGPYGGGGMYNNASSPAVTHCTYLVNLAGSSGGGMDNCFSSPAVTNCILWGDSGGEIRNYAGGSPMVTHSDIQGGYDGVGNIHAAPLFVWLGGGDYYHLGPGSPCLDAGTNDAPSLPDYDFEGDPRVLDGNRDGTATVDMGVDEAFWYAVHLPLVFRSF